MHPRARHFLPWLLLLLFVWVAVKSAWLSDDAYITLRTVSNWLAGFGPVWNVGERVQAYTHPLWLLALTGAVGVTREYFFTTLVLSLALAAGAFAIVVGRLAVDWASALLAGGVLILAKASVDYSTSGLENALTHLLLALFLWMFLRGAATLRTLFWLALLTALAAVNRLDSVLLFAPPLLYAAWRQRRQWPRALGVMALGFLPLLAWETFSLIYYGFPLPNTFYAKLNTGLPLAPQIQQGFFYLLHSASTDPLTLAAIAAGLTLPWLRRDARQAAAAVGIACYLLYTVRIGGDFMAGRFLSAPLFASAVILAQQPLLALPRWQLATIFAVTLGLGFANPAQSPWLSGASYAVAAIDERGIADERGHYYQRYGLLPANRDNRLTASGAITGTPDPALFEHCGIGMRGFLAGPYTHIVDFCGLADALLARLPVVYDPDWRIGHPIRHLPAGYLGTIRSGENHLTDADLAHFYDQLRLVIAGPLFDPARWRAIWAINSAQLPPTRNPAAYVYPGRATKAWADFDRTWPESVATAADPDLAQVRGAVFDAQGVTIDLGGRQHAPLIDLGTDAAAFDLIFLADGREIGRTPSTQTPLLLDEERFTVLSAPAAVAAQGYTGLILAPRQAGEHRLTRVALFDPAAWNAAPPHAGDLLRLYYFAFYRMTGAARAALVAELLPLIQRSPPDGWRDIAPAATAALLKMPDPALQAVLLAHAVPNQMLLDSQDAPVLRYLGHRSEALPATAAGSGAQVRLFFEVLALESADYTLWFHAENQETGAEFMLYDWPLPRDAAAWTPGMIAEVPVFIALEPGEYKLTAGLWTPATRQRLYADRGADVYWLDLGVVHAEAPPPGAAPASSK